MCVSFVTHSVHYSERYSIAYLLIYHQGIMLNVTLYLYLSRIYNDFK